MNKAETMGKLRTELTIARPDLDPDPLLKVLAPRIGADGRLRRVSGQVVSIPDAVALVISAADAEAAPPAAPQATTTSPVDLRAFRNGLLAQRAREAAQRPGTITDVMNRLSSPLDRVGPGR
jgi:hypothetical protein